MIAYLEQLVEEGKYQKALGVAEQILLNREIDLKTLALVNCTILMCRLYLNELHGALAVGQLAVSLSRDVEEWDRFGAACLNLGAVYSRLRQHDAAIAITYEYLSNLQRYRTAQKHEALAWYNLGVNYRKIGEFDQAVSAFQRALQAAERAQEPRAAHSVRHALVEAYLAKGEFAPVPAILVRCLHYIRHNPEAPDIGESRCWHFQYRAEFAIRTGRLHRGRLIAEKALAGATGKPTHQYYYCMILARLALLEQNYREAFDRSLSARVYAIQSQAFDLEIQVSEFLYGIIKEYGDAVLTADLPDSPDGPTCQILPQAEASE